MENPMSARLVAAAIAAALPAFAQATDLVSPALVANNTQYLECNIVNVSASSVPVRISMYMGDGTLLGAYTNTLTPGQAWGISLAGYYAGVYCRFSVKTAASDYRASIDILDIASPNRVVTALSAY
jgi:hypothetical protein